MPSQRRQVILALRGLANADDKWENLSSDSGHNNAQENHASENNNDELHHNFRGEALEEIETAASNLRCCNEEYFKSLDQYHHSLRSFWLGSKATNNSQPEHVKSELATVGGQLASNLLCQLKWDKELGHAILIYLEKDLYRNIENYSQQINIGNSFNQIHNSRLDNNHSSNKLRAWSDSMSQMIQIDKPFWNFVECEVYDDTELFENDEPEFLNGEPSSQFISVGHSAQQIIAQGGEESPTHDIPGSLDQRNLHNLIISSNSIEDAVDIFLHNKCRSTNNIGGRIPASVGSRSVTLMLLVGEEGCGKTHMLDSIQQHARGFSSESKGVQGKSRTSSIEVIRPKFPVDLVGNSIGSSEDRLIALFSYASNLVSTTTSKSKSRKCLILLDDIDKMFSISDGINTSDSPDVADGSSALSHIGRRCKALFLSIIDALREIEASSENDGHLLLLCTARSICDGLPNRFDKSFLCGQPDEIQRRKMILSCLSNDEDTRKGVLAESDITDDRINEILSLVAHHSAGRSAVELSQCCRETILIDAKSASSTSFKTNGFVKGHSVLERRLHHLDIMLQAMSPQSLKSGSLDGIVEMRIFTPEELKSKLTTDKNGEILMPLLGADANRAYEALMNVLITPLCRSDEIRSLLYGGTNQSSAVDVKPIRVGALLAGKPGVGKSVLAYHCASLAAKMARVTLIDVSCTSLIHKEIGGSERAVHRLFSAVRSAAPCILLLDGIENIAPRRGNDNTSEGTMDRVLSTFLTEMDGIESGSSGVSGNVAVIGITHNPDLIDPSLRRPGRLEKTITLGAPDCDARRELVAQHIKDLNIDFSSSGYFDAKNKNDLSQFVALQSADMSAVEVIAICREASMECLREIDFDIGVIIKPTLKYEHFKTAIRIMKGTNTT